MTYCVHVVLSREDACPGAECVKPPVRIADSPGVVVDAWAELNRPDTQAAPLA